MKCNEKNDENQKNVLTKTKNGDNIKKNYAKGT